MNRWIIRSALIVIAAGLVATALPGLREWLAADACIDSGRVYDYAARVCRNDIASLPTRDFRFMRIPDTGSVVVALFVAIALARLFITLDRRAKARVAAA
jgi:hypothetical protein